MLQRQLTSEESAILDWVRAEILRVRMDAEDTVCGVLIIGNPDAGMMVIEQVTDHAGLTDTGESEAIVGESGMCIHGVRLEP